MELTAERDQLTLTNKRVTGFGGPRADALVKYRLRNEAETYSELVFVNNWLNPERIGTRLVQDGNHDPAKTLNLQSNDASIEFRLREMFVQGGNLFSGRLAQAKFWAGQRYYMRGDIHINDFYYSDLSGYGSGVEDIPLGNARASLAYIGSTQASSPEALPGNVAKSTIDARLQGIKAPAGEFDVWYDYAFARSGRITSEGVTLSSANGHAFGLQHRRRRIGGHCSM